MAAKKNPPPDRTVTVKLPAPPKLKQIQGDDRVVHALDRLTFGPRPAISDLGQPLYGRQTPDSMLSAPWVNSSALLERMNFSLALAANRLSKGVTVDWLGQLGAALVLPDLEERQIENLIMRGQISERTRALILQQLATAPVTKPVAIGQPAAEQQAHRSTDRQASLTAGLLFGSPDFQRR